MELTQQPELRQKTTLSPQVYQGLSILAMPVVELQVLVENEILENPVLEIDDYEEDGVSDEEERGDHASEDERAWDEWLDQYEELERIDTVTPRDPNAEDINSDEYVGGLRSLEEYLSEQIAMLGIAPGVRRAAHVIVGLLDDDGFFPGDISEVAGIADVSLSVAEEALAIVQQLDPPGVGARSLTEALYIQAEAVGVASELLLRIIDEHLDSVAAHQFQKIARTLGVQESAIRCEVEVLRTLNPRPAGAFSQGIAPAYIIPDVTLRRFDDEWLVIPNNEALPVLRVSPRYRSMLRTGSSADEATRKYLKDKIKSAESFMRNVDRRRDTVSRIAQVVLEAQRDFFEDGKGDLRPLKLEDVAAEIGVHLSTVSRGVTGKYVATPYGLFELRHFFSGGYRTATGMDVAATTVKQRLKETIAAEDANHPLSDQALAEVLREHGIDLARRTVAKYREELGIEPSWARRRRQP